MCDADVCVVQESVYASDESSEGLDEFVVPPALLDKMMSMAGLRKRCSENFHDFFNRHTKDLAHSRSLPGNVKRLLDWRGSLSDDEWEVAGVCLLLPQPSPVLVRPCVS